MTILKRTVYYDFTGGIARFWGWARVTTNIGTMVEPFHPGNRVMIGQDFEDFVPDDEINRIDEIRAKPIDVEQLTLSDDHVHGGDPMPRDGR